MTHLLKIQAHDLTTIAAADGATPALDRVFVLNLARRPERLAKMRERLDRAGMSALAEPIAAVDGATLTADAITARGFAIYRNWKAKDAAHFYHARDLKLGEVGCAMSHWQAWERIVAEGIGAALILEDDAVLSADASAVLAAELAWLAEHEPDWDLCYAGRKRMLSAPFAPASPAPEPKVAGRLVVPSFSYNLHAYVVSNRGAQKLLASGFNRALIPVDELVPALYCEHPRADVRELFSAAPRLRAFAVEPAVAWQAGEGSDTERSAWLETVNESVDGEAARFQAIARVLAGEDRSIVARDLGTSERALADLCDAFLQRSRGKARAPFGLATLLATSSPAEFMAEAWPHEVAVAHGPVERFELPPELFDVRRLARTPGLRFSVFGKKGFRVNAGGPDDALAFYDRGDTLYIVGLHRAFPAIDAACRALARDLDVDPRHVHVEAFASPPGAGASLHYDFDVNFNVQLVGEKSWRVAPNEHVENPLRSHHVKAGVLGVDPFQGLPLPRAMPADAAKHEARPGSVVFLPRGVWHETAVHTASIAIAFVIKPPTIATLVLEELDARLRIRPEWRAYALGADRAHKVARALADLPALVATLSPEEVLFDVIRARWPEGAKPLLRRLRRPRHGEPWMLGVTTARGRLEFPIAAALLPAVRWLTGRDGVFSTEELAAACPETSRDSARRIMAYLVDTGAIERA